MSDKEETDEVMRYVLERALVRDLRVNHAEARNMVNHWQDEMRAEAWDEGYSASEAEWMHTFDGHPVPEGEMCPECSIGNPYRTEKDA